MPEDLGHLDFSLAVSGMEEAHRDLLREKYIQLSDALKYGITEVVSILWSQKILSNRMKEDILEGHVKGREKAETLLDILPSRGEKAFEAFCRAVEAAELHDAVAILNTGIQVSCTEESGLVGATAAYNPGNVNHQNENVHNQASSSGNRSPCKEEDLVDSLKRLSGNSIIGGDKDVEGIESGKDLADGPGNEWLGAEPLFRFVLDTDEEVLKKFAKHLHDQENYYQMSSDPRGTALIINNIDFENPLAKERSLKRRDGAENDSAGLSKLFKHLGFKVCLKENLTTEKMRDLLKEHLASEELKDSDCFVLFLMSHGDKGVVFGTDGFRGKKEPHKPQNFLDLTDVRDLMCGTENLREKPKLLFVQACQGKKMDEGVDVPSKAASSNVGIPESGDLSGDQKLTKEVLDNLVPTDVADGPSRLPTYADFFVAMSTREGFSTKRGEGGGWFIQAVIKIFSEHAYNKELGQLMRKVNNVLSGRGEKKKQIGEVKESLRKELYFFPGLPRATHTSFQATASCSTDVTAQGYEQDIDLS